MHKANKVSTKDKDLNETNKGAQLKDIKTHSCDKGLLVEDISKAHGVVLELARCHLKDKPPKGKEGIMIRDQDQQERKRRVVVELKLGRYCLNCLSRPLTDEETHFRPGLSKRMAIYVVFLVVVIAWSTFLVWLTLKYPPVLSIVSLWCVFWAWLIIGLWGQ
jgi:hypothetical protein